MLPAKPLHINIIPTIQEELCIPTGDLCACRPNVGTKHTNCILRLSAHTLEHLTLELSNMDLTLEPTWKIPKSFEHILDNIVELFSHYETLFMSL